MAGRSSRRQGGGNERIQALVEEKLQEGLQYEALQLYRGVVARKSARGDYGGAISISEQGIGVLLRAGYADSATELGSVIVGVLSDRELSPTEERVSVIKRINNAFEDTKRAEILAEEDRRATELENKGKAAVKDPDAMQNGMNESGEAAIDGKERARGKHSVGTLQGRFLKQAVDWTAAHGSRVNGDPSLCALLGRCLWYEGDIERGTKYLVLGERPQELCDLIIQDVPEGIMRDQAIAKGVLQFASKSSLRDANALLSAYKTRIDIKPKGLLAFCGLLLKTCEHDAGPVFQKLIEAYGNEVSVDKSTLGAVEKIGLMYFGIRLRPPTMLDNIMGMLSGMPK